MCAVFNAELTPLAFNFWQRDNERDDGTTDTVLVWTSERYGVTVHIMVSQSWLTSFSYHTGELRGDGSSAEPKALAELPGRVPDRFDEVRSGTGDA